MKVVIIGKGQMLANLILGVLEANVEIAGVFRYEYTVKSKYSVSFWDLFTSAPEVTLIKKYKLKQLKFKSANSNEFQKFLIKNNVDLLIVGTWREKLIPEVYNIPKIASINVHPSLLPKYRGPNPYLQTILHGEEYSGITFHLIDKNFDTGAILKQEKIKIYENDTSKELRERTVIKARELTTELLNELRNKILTPVEQNEKISSYYKNITGDERMLNFEAQSSLEISRTIRALHPFLPAYITYRNKFFIVDPYSFTISADIINKAKAGTIISKDYKNRSLTIICSDNKAITFNNLKLYKNLFTANYIKKHVDISH